jgi:hypothetical protein
MPHARNNSGWSTTSFGGPAGTSPMELAALSDHLSSCRRHQGVIFSLACAAERLHRYLAGRLVTSLVVAITLLVGSGAWAMHAGLV